MDVVVYLWAVCLHWYAFTPYHATVILVGMLTMANSTRVAS